MAEKGKDTREGGSSGGGGGGDGDRFEVNLESKFEGLNLHGEEEEELDLSGEVEELLEEIRWIGVFRVHTQRPFSHVALFKDMRNAWASAKDVIFKTMGDNRFLVQFLCLGDWNRVMNGGPWLFRRDAVVIEEYDGLTNVHEYKLDRIPVCARIMGIPDGLMQKSSLAEKIAKKVGGNPIKVFVSEGRLNPAKYLRARVFVNLETPLVRFVPLTLKESKRYPVEYEKLPKFYHFCGLIGHEVTECGDGVHNPEDCDWGDWLLVQYDNSNNNGQGVPRGGGNMRSGGVPGGNRSDLKDHGSQEPMNLDPGSMIAPMARKRLINGDDTASTNPGGAVAPPPGFVNNKVNLIEYGSVEAVDKSKVSTPEKVQVQKRLKFAGTESSSSENTSATSHEEDRRQQ
ncbi:hypothetical protein CFC21_102001 [Triticum aestivum]|uniref:DUF4283 domain-containing protein n=2 Tax=Triticum aestivum TaxID=4565 RepID=A0A9R1M4C5_WHEAT|nr:hypothetical protein CFC21_102001 [Triticum aestivum]